MKTVDEILAKLAAMKGEPAPEYCYDETGIAHRALQVREQKRWLEWNGNEEPGPIDELPEHAR